MKLIHILNESEQVKSYDKKYGKIKLDVIKNPRQTAYSYVAYEYKGEIHRNDGKPAFVYNNGTKKWYVDGRLHREDGPAVEYGSGTVGDDRYFLKGKHYSKEEWEEALDKK